MPPVISVQNLSKRYILSHQFQRGYATLRETLSNSVRHFANRLLHPSSQEEGPAHEEFWALNDVSFDIRQGDRIGVIGRNGAGKSTLLKILSRITEPTSGQVTIRGRVTSLLEVGTGFHPELTGRENIFLNGAILGMSRAEIRKKFDAIVNFAEVERFLDTPVKRYSSGMYVRLAFSVAAHLEPEILIVDEVLAVGDAQFQKKCLGKLREVGNEGRTVLFVSHNMGAIAQLCDKCLLLENGKLKSQGSVNDTIGEYLASGTADTGQDAATFAVDENLPSSVLGVSLLDSNSQAREAFDLDDEITIRITYRVKEPIEDLLTVLTVSRNGAPVFATYSSDQNENYLVHEPGTYRADCIIPRMFLKAGCYQIDVNTTTPHVDFQKFANVASFDVEETSINTHLKGYRANRPGDVIFQGRWEIENEGR